MAILTFGMSLIGTFLVRSGVLTSVHSFAIDPTRGVFILVLIALVIGGGLLLYALRAPGLEAGNPFALVSREGALVLNNLLLCAGMATVFLGTFYPLFAEVWSGVKLSVGPQYFDATFVPILMPGILAMVIGPVLAWRRGNLASALRRLAPALVGALLAPFFVFLFDRTAPPAALAGVALAVWAMLGVLTDLADRSSLGKLPLGTAWRRLCHLPRGTWGYALAHFGVGVLIAGIVVSTAWRSERIETMHAGDTLQIAGRTLHFVGVTDGDVANYHVQRAQIVVDRPGSAAMTLYPERRWYPVARSQTTNTAIATNGFGDLYLALGDPDGQGGWVLRAYYNPLVPWIWFGAILAALGGLVSLSDRRLRMRLPAARASAAIAAALGQIPDDPATAVSRHVLLIAIGGPSVLTRSNPPSGSPIRRSRRAPAPSARSCAASFVRTSRSTNQTPISPTICVCCCASAWSPATPISRSSTTSWRDTGSSCCSTRPSHRSTWLLWLTPPLLVLGAGGLLLLRARRRRPEPVTPVLTPEESARAALLLGDHR